MDIVKKTDSLISGLHKLVSLENWFDFSKLVFLRKAKESESKLHEIRTNLEKIQEDLQLEGFANPPLNKELIENLKKLENFLLNNLELESKKKSEEPVPDLYSDIQNKILILLLEAKYYIEKVKIYLNTTEEPKKEAKSLLEALRKRTEELENLKRKYEETRRKSYFGILPESTYLDLESELEENRVLIERAVESYEKESAFIKESISSLLSHLQKKEEEYKKIVRHLKLFLHKSNEYSKRLKKERDFAQKVALEVESEVAHIRGHYLDSILQMEKEKQLYRSEIEGALENKYSKIQEENIQMRDMIIKLREIISDYDKKLSRLEEENKRLKAISNLHKKHKEMEEKFK